MKYLKLLAIILLIISCSNKKELKGYWYGEFEKDKTNPVLFKFEGYTYIDFNSIHRDTIKYNYFSNNLYSEENEFGEKRGFKYKLENNKLSFFNIKNDSLLITLKRPRKNSIVLEYLKETSLKIDLPKAQGFKKIFGYEFRLRNPFYLTYQNDTLVANFLDSTIKVNKSYFKYLLKKQETNFDLTYNHWRRIPFIADKNIKISDFKIATDQLKMSSIHSADFILKTDGMDYENLNIFSLRLPQLNEKEYKIFEEYNIENEEILMPPTFFTKEILTEKENKNKIILIELSDEGIKLNEEVISMSDLKEQLVDIIEEKHEVFIFYHLDEDMTYQDYVDFNLLFMKSIYSVRADYLKQKHNINYTSEESYRELDERGQEAFDKYPMILHMLDASELQMTKQVIFDK